MDTTKFDTHKELTNQVLQHFKKVWIIFIVVGFVILLRPHQIKVSGHGSDRPYILRNQKIKVGLFLVMCLFLSPFITFSIFCCWKCQKTSNSQQILVQLCMHRRPWVSEDVLHAVSNDQKYDLFQIQGHKNTRNWEYAIISPVLNFGHTCTPNKFQLKLV